MKFSPTQIRELAADTHFPPENLEKVLRLRELLIEFHKHTVLNGKLVLKGGTALNLFYLNLARLSYMDGQWVWFESGVMKPWEGGWKGSPNPTAKNRDPRWLDKYPGRATGL